MLSNAMRVFIASGAQGGSRRLHPACVTSFDAGSITIRSIDPSLEIEPGTDTLLYYEHNREFMQQPARVDALLDEQSIDTSDDMEDAPESSSVAADIAIMMQADEQEFDQPRPQTCVVQLIGDPVSAESRQCYRVSAVTSDRHATLGIEDNCQLLDVSQSGFSVMSGELHAIGTQIEATHEHDGKRYTGTACVQSVKPMSRGSHRYGLYCTDDGKRQSLIEGLQKISMAVQREQLRRRARA